jgi:hypothetical protein
MLQDLILKKYLGTLKEKMQKEKIAAYVLAVNESGETEIYSVSEENNNKPITVGECTVIKTEQLNKIKHELNKLKFNL